MPTKQLVRAATQIGRANDALVTVEAQMRKRVEEAQVATAERDFGNGTGRVHRVRDGGCTCSNTACGDASNAPRDHAEPARAVDDKARHVDVLAYGIHHGIGDLRKPAVDGATAHMRRRGGIECSVGNMLEHGIGRVLQRIVDTVGKLHAHALERVGQTAPTASESAVSTASSTTTTTARPCTVHAGSAPKHASSAGSAARQMPTAPKPNMSAP